MTRHHGTCIAALLALIVGGCGAQPNAQRTTLTRPVVAVNQARGPEEPKDAPVAVPMAYQVEIQLVSFPVGAYSSNEDFWKHMDEQCVDPATSDLLYKNGIRIGVARNSELEHFKKFIADVAPFQAFTMAGTDVRDRELKMRSSVPEQKLFYYDRRNNSIGRDFTASDNVLNISFEPAMRKPGTLRLTICPMVRSAQQRPQFTVLGNELTFQYVNDEKLYDLNCKADIPPDCFLIITPSPDAWRRTSIGNGFLIKDAPAERREQVLLVIPRALKIEAPKSQVTMSK